MAHRPYLCCETRCLALRRVHPFDATRHVPRHVGCGRPGGRFDSRLVALAKAAWRLAVARDHSIAAASISKRIPRTNDRVASFFGPSIPGLEPGAREPVGTTFSPTY